MSSTFDAGCKVTLNGRSGALGITCGSVCIFLFSSCRTPENGYNGALGITGYTGALKWDEYAEALPSRGDVRPFPIVIGNSTVRG